MNDTRRALITLAGCFCVASLAIIYVFAVVFSPNVPADQRADSETIRQSFTYTTQQGKVFSPPFVTAIQPLNLGGVWLVLAAVPIILAVCGIGVIFFLFQQRQGQRRRDTRRRADLHALVQGFALYYRDRGTYPISLTFDPHYYSLVNFSNDWAYYGMPEVETMRRYIPAWPLLDPLKPLDQVDQTSQYMYYPRDNGQRYDIFARLEAPLTSEAADYNHIESIPDALGRYNYKVSSAATPPHSEVEHATAPQADPSIATSNPGA